MGPRPMVTPGGERLFSQGEVDEAIDRDRIASFMQFMRGLPASHSGVIQGTTNQCRSIMRALERAGF